MTLPPPGPHGGDGVTVAAALGLDPEAIVDLSVSLNPFAPSVDGLVAHHASAVRHYPDSSFATDALAATLDVDPDRVLLTNGGSEAISLVAREIGGHVDEPEFALHPRGTGGPRWRSDPHNPTGRLAPPDETADVWDEAFYALATGRWTAGRDAIAVGSLTKVFACPGLRLGYLLADDVDRFARHQPTWPVSGVALAVMEDLLDDAPIDAWAKAIASQRTRLVELLTTHRLKVEAAQAPWVLVHEPELRTRLAPHGVVVRDCASFGLPGVARVAVPDEAGLEALATALEVTEP
jgi:histidinol-phosphate/aromatic aminotransferase/cobyric acid decarboxylase-like protein